jgi:hypothetical protein
MKEGIHGENIFHQVGQIRNDKVNLKWTLRDNDHIIIMIK